jgi:hypothetical protein
MIHIDFKAYEPPRVLEQTPFGPTQGETYFSVSH